ncbi:hypothetical protein FQA47_010695 [Oryzias melastigma]|uniref:Uncharacterized protein n=1 Tax=Oryzias melastigma TaxID=30732 RepID=A0A834F1V8_ORYME|nr:hypothetical protein FQA47_010695 [Oryzias melastigma]
MNESNRKRQIWKACDPGLGVVWRAVMAGERLQRDQLAKDVDPQAKLTKPTCSGLPVRRSCEYFLRVTWTRAHNRQRSRAAERLRALLRPARPTSSPCQGPQLPVKEHCTFSPVQNLLSTFGTENDPRLALRKIAQSQAETQAGIPTHPMCDAFLTQFPIERSRTPSAVTIFTNLQNCTTIRRGDTKSGQSICLKLGSSNPVGAGRRNRQKPNLQRSFHHITQCV